MSPPRVLFIAPFCAPPRSAEGIVNAKLVLAMLDAGWHVDVITDGRSAMAYYPGGESAWKPVLDVSWPLLEPELPSKAGALARLALQPRPIPMLGLRWTLAAIALGRRLVAARRHDVVLSRSTPDHAHTAALEIHRTTGVPWIANWNDPQPEYVLPPPYGRGLRTPLRLIDKWAQRSIAQHATWVTFPCERQRRYMLQYLAPGVESKSSVIPHIAAARFAADAPRDPSTFVLCHAGDLTPPRDPTTLLEGVRRFLAANPMVPLRLVFAVHRPEKVVAAARTLGLDEVVRFEPLRPYVEMPPLLASADVLVSLEADLCEGIFFPSKLVDYAQVGRPILAVAPNAGTAADVLGAWGGGIAADVRSPDAVARAIATLWAARSSGTLDAKYGSRSLFARFGEGAVLETYRALFDRIGVCRSSAQSTLHQGDEVRA